MDQVGALEIARRADGAQTDEEQQQRTELKSVPRVRMVSLTHEKRVSHPVAFVLTKVKLEGSPVLWTKDASECFLDANFSKLFRKKFVTGCVKIVTRLKKRFAHGPNADTSQRRNEWAPRVIPVLRVSASVA